MITLAERLIVPLRLLDEELLERSYVHYAYTSDCSKCECLPQRQTDPTKPLYETCEECPGFEGRIRLYKQIDNEHVGLPLGDRKKLLQVFPMYRKYLKAGKVKDLRPRPKIHSSIRFTGKLYDYQEEATAKLLVKKHGILLSKPRSGKTCMATYVACKMGLKTLITASQHDFLEQFYETFCGTDGEQGFTNIKQVEKKIGRPLIGFCRTISDFKKYDICLATYQTFISDLGKDKFQKVKDLFGLVVVDECHQMAAKAFSTVLANLNAYAKFGLTATIERKDGREFLVKEIIGPVTAKTNVKSLIPVVKFHETNINTDKRYQQWFQAENFLYKNEERTELIVKYAVRDLKAGRSLVIPVTRVHHALTIVRMVNELYGRNIAQAFTGSNMNKATRRKLILQARQGKIRCVVGIRKIIQHGLNVPRWDTYYGGVSMISNKSGLEQETARILTPMEGKNRPLIRFFADWFGPARGCAQTVFWQCYTRLKFHMSDETRAKFKHYLNKKSTKTNKPKVGRF